MIESSLASQNEPERILLRPRQFRTDQGSLYTCADDGLYTRYKEKTGEQFRPAKLTVFMDMGEHYNPWREMPFLVAAQSGARHTYIAEINPNTQETSFVYEVEDISFPDSLIVIACDPATGDPVARASASLYPLPGRQVYEELLYTNPAGETEERFHVGNRVTEIIP